ncbi:MAG: glycosyltransferase [bacterium]
MPQALSVLLLNKAYPPWPGGIEFHVKQLAEGLVDRGSNVTVLCAGNHLFAYEERRGPLRIFREKNWATVWSQPLSPALLRHTRRIEADIVHIHTPFPLGLLACQLRKNSSPLVVTWHSDVIRQWAARPFLAPLERRVLQRATAIVTTSPRLLEQSGVLPAFREKCHVIPLGIDATRFTTPTAPVRELADKLRASLPHPLVVFVGRLVRYKGLDVLLRALARTSASAVIVGSGPMRPELERTVQREGIEKRVTFAGFVSDRDLPAYLHAADMFALPSVSRNEAFGICQLEAMATGLPVIGTDLPGGVPWVNRHNETGLVVPPGDVQSLAEAIETLVSNPNQAKDLGAAGRRRVLERFTLEQSLTSHEQLYRSLLYPPCEDS